MVICSLQAVPILCACDMVMLVLIYTSHGVWHWRHTGSYFFWNWSIVRYLLYFYGTETFPWTTILLCWQSLHVSITCKAVLTRDFASLVGIPMLKRSVGIYKKNLPVVNNIKTLNPRRLCPSSVAGKQSRRKESPK